MDMERAKQLIGQEVLMPVGKSVNGMMVKVVLRDFYKPDLFTLARGYVQLDGKDWACFTCFVDDIVELGKQR